MSNNCKLCKGRKELNEAYKLVDKKVPKIGNHTFDFAIVNVLTEIENAITEWECCCNEWKKTKRIKKET